VVLRTPLCDLLGIEVPLVQAPVCSAPALAAAVSEAGGLGMLQLSWLEAGEAREAVRKTRRRTRRAFGVNLVLEWPQEERLELALEEGVRIVSFFWGDPAAYAARVHEHDGLVLCTVAGAEEARRVVAAGADVVVAQGWEAGGHVWGEVTTLALVPRVVDAVDPVPVVAAGGIADGRGFAAALALGAAGVWVGTRFVASEEAELHPDYKERVLRAAETDTFWSSVFDVGWPDAPHRTLRNSTIRSWEAAGRPEPGRRPGEGETVAVREDGSGVVRYAVSDPAPGMTGELEALALYAGQGAGLVREILPAAEIVRTMAAEAEHSLERLSLLRG
jgi:nitronate monooxygenase